MRLPVSRLALSVPTKPRLVKVSAGIAVPYTMLNASAMIASVAGVMLPMAVTWLGSKRYPKTGLPLLSVVVMTRSGNEIAWVPASALAKLPVTLLTANWSLETSPLPTIAIEPVGIAVEPS